MLQFPWGVLYMQVSRGDRPPPPPQRGGTLKESMGTDVPRRRSNTAESV